MLYYLAKYIMSPALSCYFRRAYFLGQSRIPSRGPVIVIANHAASFLDAMLMGVMLKRPIHFYVRSDVFKGRIARFIFAQLHMIPIYSESLARGEVYKNLDSFSVGEEVLRKGGVLLIFPEGISRIERNILPIKKGVARIALQTLQRGADLPVVVVPIGIHYSRHDFRGDVQLVTGEPLRISGYAEEYALNPARAVNRLTAALETIFQQVVLFVSQPERSLLLQGQLEMLDNERGKFFGYEDFYKQKELCERISQLDHNGTGRLESAQTEYFSLLEEKGLDDITFAGREITPVPFFILAVTAPLFMAGIFLNVWPFFFGRWVANKKVTRIDFYSSVFVAVSAISYTFWILLILSTAIIFSSNWLLALFVCSPFLSVFALHWFDHFRNWWYNRQGKSMQRQNPGLYQQILAKRQSIRGLGD